MHWMYKWVYLVLWGEDHYVNKTQFSFSTLLYFTAFRMGAEESKSSGSSSCPSYASSFVDFPNSCRKESDATAWTLLHQITVDKWKEGHAGSTKN